MLGQVVVICISYIVGVSLGTYLSCILYEKIADVFRKRQLVKRVGKEKANKILTFEKQLDDKYSKISF